ncbi:nucleotidyl transferase AbiEii/AbiGii toxin family protein (plasmid) [Tunturibacter psychrotolerans]|uniref:Nucleotidyl transferase AbiEii/AbiGii toxin family protein n=1 Tax=Tunturiibacter psychrotolerans TaxID=3069686 RepID=A0AAU7ZXC8_9BACT
MPTVSTLDHNEVRRIAITAVFSDDYFFEKVVLKGGNALAIALGLSDRTSLDLDFSIENDFDDVAEAEHRLKTALERRFATVGWVVFDFVFSARPFTPREGQNRWGGYVVEFKLMEKARYLEIGDDKQAHRRESLVVGPRQQRKFTIELSKFEFTKGKLARELDSFDIYVYAPEMIAIEKLRAICQQMPGYPLNRTPSARARDFYDIHLIVTETGTDLGSEENADLLRNIFEAKDVPVELLQLIAEQREFHRPDWDSVRGSVPQEGLRDFDFYFDFVLEQVKLIKAFGNK